MTHGFKIFKNDGIFINKNGRKLYLSSLQFEIRNATFDIWRQFLKQNFCLASFYILNLRNDEGRRLYFHLRQRDFLLQIQTS